jgi:hypothetical protein
MASPSSPKIRPLSEKIRALHATASLTPQRDSAVAKSLERDVTASISTVLTRESAQDNVVRKGVVADRSHGNVEKIAALALLCHANRIIS